MPPYIVISFDNKKNPTIRGSVKTWYKVFDFLIKCMDWDLDFDPHSPQEYLVVDSEFHVMTIFPVVKR